MGKFLRFNNGTRSAKDNTKQVWWSDHAICSVFYKIRNIGWWLCAASGNVEPKKYSCCIKKAYWQKYDDAKNMQKEYTCKITKATNGDAWIETELNKKSYSPSEIGSKILSHL